SGKRAVSAQSYAPPQRHRLAGNVQHGRRRHRSDEALLSVPGDERAKLWVLSSARVPLEYSAKVNGVARRQRLCLRRGSFTCWRSSFCSASRSIDSAEKGTNYAFQTP